MVLVTLAVWSPKHLPKKKPETNSKFAPENRPQTFQKERIIFQTNLFSAVFAVSFRDGYTILNAPDSPWKGTAPLLSYSCPSPRCFFWITVEWLSMHGAYSNIGHDKVIGFILVLAIGVDFNNPLEGNIYLVYKRYILPIGRLYILYTSYHPLQEPEKSFDQLIAFLSSILWWLNDNYISDINQSGLEKINMLYDFDDRNTHATSGNCKLSNILLINMSDQKKKKHQ